MLERPRTGRLFAGSCAAIAALATSFAALGDAMYSLKGEFLLDNAQIGIIGGAGLWGMAISQVGFSSLCDVIGMRTLLRVAAIGHVIGLGLLVSAGGFASLLAGALVLAIANGVVEAVCNPLVAALFPDRKAAMLNRLHLWFPAGVALGGLALWILGEMGADWRAKMLIVLLPVAIYTLLFARERFPATRIEAPVRRAIASVATTPLLWLLMALMAVTMSLELGPNRWIPAVLQAGGMPGILILVLINSVMAVMRANAGRLLDHASPPIVLALSCAVAGTGLFLLSHSGSLAETMVSAIIFALGISVVWPTMMGFVAERTPRTGALGLGLMAAAGSLAVGLVTTPLLGRIADERLPRMISEATTQTIARQVLATPAINDALLLRDAERVLAGLARPDEVGDLMRRTAATGPARLRALAAPTLAAGENASGLYAFRFLVPLAALVSLIFLAIALLDRRSGGYGAAVARAHSKDKTTA